MVEIIRNVQLEERIVSESIFEWDVGGICRFWEEGMEMKWLGGLLEPLTNVISCLCVAMTW